MCKRPSERAADDLLAFVRRTRRVLADREDLSLDPLLREALDDLDSAARHLLAKHGLLTTADDPEVAAVFMDDTGLGPLGVPRHDGKALGVESPSSYTGAYYNPVPGTPEAESRHFPKCTVCGRRLSAHGDGCLNPKCDNYALHLRCGDKENGR